MKAELVGLLIDYLKQKGLQTALIQSLNFIVPVAPIIAELGIDFLVDIAPMLLESYGV